MDDPKRDLNGDLEDRKYEVDPEAVAGSIIRQLANEQMWIRYPEVMPLGRREMFVSPQPDDLLPGPEDM